MTEQEWLTCADPVLLFRHLEARTTERKLRLFATATLRTAFQSDADSQSNLEMADQFADGVLSIHDLRRCWPRLQPDNPKVAPENAYDWAETIVMAKERGYYGGSFPVLDQFMLCHLLRDILGNPFHFVTLAAHCLSATIVGIAQQMYEHGDFSSMPILGDALDDAGCTSHGVLQHCRQPGPHVRGCWVVDLILGKG